MTRGFRQRRRGEAGAGARVQRQLLAEVLEERHLLSNVFPVTNTLDDGSLGSLRWAITQVNADPADSPADPDRIVFDIPQSDPGFSDGVWTIAPTSQLPAITNPAVIDGYTQAGAAPNTNGPGLRNNTILTVVLNGGRAPQGANGLTLSSAGIVLRGLVINGFIGAGFSAGGAGVAIDTVGYDRIEGNFIGTDVKGTTAVGNSSSGIFIYGFGRNTIGGMTPGTANILSGNLGGGIDLIGANASGNLIAGNIIGADVTGRQSIPNATGVTISFGSENTIGGTSAGARNVISGNRGNGISIYNNETAGNLVEGNYIGTDISGAVPLVSVPGNGFDLNGIMITNPIVGNTIGGTTAGSGNVISGNFGGILIASSRGVQNLVEGNLVGTDATGLKPVGNYYGVSLVETSGTTVGGTTGEARNVISANVTTNVFISGGSPSQDVIQGNYIGLDRTGSAALNGPLINGQTYVGVQIAGSSGVTIGGTAQGAGNVISGNLGAGIEINGSLLPYQRASQNVVEGNLIGTNAVGTKGVPNKTGIRLQSGSSVGPVTDNTIGGTATGAGNVIAYNAAGGVVVIGDTATGNAITRNSIFANAQLGIDLGGSGVPLNNMPGGPHTGPNNLQNYPVISSAIVADGQTTITGSLNSTPSQTFRIEFFSSPAADTSRFGQGKTYLGAIDVTTDANGNTPSFTFTYNGDLSHQFTTATATDLSGNTSEFAEDLEAARFPRPTVRLNPPPYPQAVGGVTISASVIVGPGEPQATGTVHFVDVTTAADLGTYTLENGGVTFAAPSLLAGHHVIAMIYSGDVNFPMAEANATVDVLKAATSTALTSAPLASMVGQPVTFTASVNAFLGVSTTTDSSTVFNAQANAPSPPLTGLVTFRDGATLLAAVPVAPNGFVTFTTSALNPGAHAIVARYSGDANYEASVSNVVTQTITVAGPTVLTVQRYGVHARPTFITLTFSEPLDAASAQNLSNYRISGPGGRPITLTSAVYDPLTQTVTLRPARNLNLHLRYRLTVNGGAPGGVADVYGNLLDGAGNGHPGSNFVTVLTARDLVLGRRVPAGPRHVARPTIHGR